MARLRLLRVHLLVVDDVVAGGDDLVDRVRALVHDEREAARAARVRVSLDVYALDITVLAKVFLQFLCSELGGLILVGGRENIR